jgi:hypothetical protein
VDEITTESEWLAAKESLSLLHHLEYSEPVSDRKWRLFACASVRTIWPMIDAEICQQAVETGELFADDLVSPFEAERVKIYAEMVAWPTQEGFTPDTGDFAASQAVLIDEGQDGSYSWRASWRAKSVNGMVWQAIMAANGGFSETKWAQRSEQMCPIIRDIFGNPFRPLLPLDPALLDWNNGTIASLAQAAYEERILPAGTLDPALLAVLADALEESGCTDTGLLGHLRSPGPHVRGCFALDLVLGKT